MNLKKFNLIIIVLVFILFSAISFSATFVPVNYTVKKVEFNIANGSNYNVKFVPEANGFLSGAVKTMEINSHYVGLPFITVANNTTNFSVRTNISMQKFIVEANGENVGTFEYFSIYNPAPPYNQNRYTLGFAQFKVQLFTFNGNSYAQVMKFIDNNNTKIEFINAGTQFNTYNSNGKTISMDLLIGNVNGSYFFI